MSQELSQQPLPTSVRLRLRLTAIDTALSLAGLAVMALYLHAVIDLSAAEWKTLVSAIAVFAVGVGVFFEVARQRLHRPLLHFLDRAREGTADSQGMREAFRAAIALPASTQRLVAGVWIAAGLVLPLTMSLLGFAGWGFGFRSFVLLAVGATGAGVTGSVSFFLTKRELTVLRETLASRIPDPEERRLLISPFPLGRKVQLAVSGCVATSVIFVVALSYSRAIAAADGAASDWQARAVGAIAARLDPGWGLAPVSLDEALGSIFPARELLPFASEFRLVDDPTGTADAEEAGESPVPMAVASRADAGTAIGAGGLELWAWARLSDGRLLISTIPRASLGADFAALRWLFGAALLVATAMAMWVARLLSTDLRQSATQLSTAADRMARGDLRRGLLHESEDELGDLARSFERMGSALRATVGRVAEAADRVDASASQIASVSQSVAAASNEQAGRIAKAMDLMVRINGQVAGVASSARALNVSVEESSSSILELGAAGEELNETASVLSSKVDEVSSSIEEMVRSVKQVRAVGDGLGDAAMETSSSMEEMASAMRAVDNTAGLTATLSEEVVASAETGQAKVSQTIAGMEAIRDATDQAETVIQGLGNRTKEIGAILDVIEDVADETNLLALNAAIIAAQAGEHGRAFSVVAEEIKELADRVLASTKEIGGLIRAVQDESANAVGAIEGGSTSVASGVQLAAEAGVALEGITRSARESGGRIREIVRAVQDQTKAAGHVVQLMDRVREGVDQIGTAGAEQDRGNETVYRSAVTMSEVAQQVRRTTEEQSRGFGRIRESVEGVREAVEQINGSLQEQSTACSQVAEFLEEVVDRTRGNAQAAEGMGEAVESLVAQAQALREDVERFRI